MRCEADHSSEVWKGKTSVKLSSSLSLDETSLHTSYKSCLVSPSASLIFWSGLVFDTQFPLSKFGIHTNSSRRCSVAISALPQERRFDYTVASFKQWITSMVLGGVLSTKTSEWHMYVCMYCIVLYCMLCICICICIYICVCICICICIYDIHSCTL